MLLAVALLFASPVLAEDVPLRPLTYDLDPKLSKGGIANFRELYVDPEVFVRGLQPAKPPVMPSVPVTPPPAEGAPGPEGAPGIGATAPMVPPTGTLLLTNDRGSWAEVAINGTKVGKVGPYIVGVVGPVPSGGYTVAFTWANGLTQAYEIATTNEPAPGAFGGKPPTLDEPSGEHTTPVPRK